MTDNLVQAKILIKCFHCGDDIRGDVIVLEEKKFCCAGCKTVYEILQYNNLCQYYSFDQTPGITPSVFDKSRFDYLADESIQKSLLQYNDENFASIVMYVPSIHCSSCIWLLENLYKLDQGVISSRVDFLKKQISINYDPKVTSLKTVVILLTSIGYEPELQLDSIEKSVESNQTRSLYYKIGIAAFAFGNSMLFSFPEYLGVGNNESLKQIFSYFNLLLGIPVFFYCSSDYFTSAIAGLKRKIINIDVPIALGIILLFFRSVYEIISQTGPGFIDSLAGLLMFLTLGKIFQSKTYDRLNFERNYKSYFPISVTTKKNGIRTTIPVAQLKKGDKILIHNNEIIPTDSFLLSGDASIDYSFVTGESRIVSKVLGEMLYAGGRQIGGIIELEVMKEVSQSYLTQLWNNVSTKEKEQGQLESLSNAVSKYFTLVILGIASVTGVYWLQYDITTAINAFTGILIIACPCALAITIPFTLGTTMRIFSKNDFYLKNISVIESLSKISTIVFDKTGTITHSQESTVEFIGDELSENELSAIKSLTVNSIHPLSKAITQSITLPTSEVQMFSEILGKGIDGIVRSASFQIGSAEFVSATSDSQQHSETRVYVKINKLIKGYFLIQNVYRTNLKEVVLSLSTYRLAVLSGDNNSERTNLQKYFPERTEFIFNQQPDQKLNYIKSLQHNIEKVLMLGDGLNDAGALLQSNVGIAVAADVTQFSPSSDAILSGNSFQKFPIFMRFSRTSMRIVLVSFLLAFIYNSIGLYFAIQGLLSPIIAAILMPASSITIVVFTTTLTKILSKKEGLL